MALTGEQLVGVAISQSMKDSFNERDMLLKSRWEAYHGKMKKPLLVEWNPQKQKFGPDDNVIINFPKSFVDAGVEALFGDDLSIEVNPPEVKPESGQPRQKSEEELYIDETLEANKLPVLLIKTATNGGVTGHVFWKLLPSHTTGEAYARIVNINPSFVKRVVNPHDKDEVLRYVIEYEFFDENDEGKAKIRREVIERRFLSFQNEDGSETTFHWTISTFEKLVGDRHFTQIGAPVGWPWEFAPIVDAENLPAADTEYGLSDLEQDVLDVCHAINRTCSLINRILRLAGYPRVYVTGMTRDQFMQNAPQSFEEMLAITDKDGKAGILELRSELTPQLEYLKKLVSLLHELTSIPEAATGKMDTTGPLSGVALKVLWSPLVAKTRRKRRAYGSLIIEAIRRILIIEGKKTMEEKSKILVNLVWPNIVPSNDLEDAQIALMDKQIGFSQDTLIKRRGGEPDEEKKKRKVEDEELAAALSRQMVSGSTSGFGANEEDGND